MSDAPLAPSMPLIGLRQWKVTDTNRLRGVSADTEWAAGDDEAHELTVGEHNGFHAYSPDKQNNLYSWASVGYNDLSKVEFYVTGVIIGWGRTVVHTTGWRSQFARPVAFASHETHVKKWGEAYRMEKTEYGDDPSRLYPEDEFVELARFYGVATVDSLAGCVDYVREEGLGIVLPPEAHLAAEHRHAMKQAEDAKTKYEELLRSAEQIERQLTADDPSARLIARLKGAAA